jgi:hypothetical protein
VKAHFSAIVAAVKAYRSTNAEHRKAEAKREQDRRFMEAAKNDPLSIFFQAKYSRASMEADFRNEN